MSLYSRVNIEEIAKKTNFTESYVKNKISYFSKIDLVETQRFKNEYLNVKLKFMGYDALALKDLVQKNILKSIGNIVGIGKESNVYLGTLDNDEECIVKFHKLGKTRFKSTKRKRDFIAGKHHSSKLYESSLNAGREVQALKELAGFIPVPRVYGHSRHVIVMQKIDGIEIHKFGHLTEEDYLKIFNTIMDYLKIILQAGIIHGDLSIYNILISPNNGDFEVYFIDWPQFIRIDHKNSFDTLLVDLNNIYSYFLKKTNIGTINIEEFGQKLIKQSKIA